MVNLTSSHYMNIYCVNNNIYTKLISSLTQRVNMFIEMKESI